MPPIVLIRHTQGKKSKWRWRQRPERCCHKPRDAWGPHAEEARKDPVLEFRGSMALRTPWSLDSWPPKLSTRINFCGFLAQCVAFYCGKPRKLTPPETSGLSMLSSFSCFSWCDLCPFPDFLPWVYFTYQANRSGVGWACTSLLGTITSHVLDSLTQHSCFPDSFCTSNSDWVYYQLRPMVLSQEYAAKSCLSTATISCRKIDYCSVFFRYFESWVSSTNVFKVLLNSTLILSSHTPAQKSLYVFIELLIMVGWERTVYVIRDFIAVLLWFIHLFTQYLLSPWYMLDVILGTWRFGDE